MSVLNLNKSFISETVFELLKTASDRYNFRNFILRNLSILNDYINQISNDFKVDEPIVAAVRFQLLLKHNKNNLIINYKYCDEINGYIAYTYNYSTNEIYVSAIRKFEPLKEEVLVPSYADVISNKKDITDITDRVSTDESSLFEDLQKLKQIANEDDLGCLYYKKNGSLIIFNTLNKESSIYNINKMIKIAEVLIEKNIEFSISTKIIQQSYFNDSVLTYSIIIYKDGKVEDMVDLASQSKQLSTYYGELIRRVVI